MIRNRPPEPGLRRYAAVEAILAANIACGRLAPGFVLLEGPVAEALRTTRPPVQRALRNLADRGVVQRFNGRGYLVGAGPALHPLRTDIRTIALEFPAEAEEALASRSSAERIFEHIERDVAGCIVFGQYRIVEAALAEYFSVSRTVARDVLGRLEERGLVRRNQSSHWLAGPLTAQAIREHFAVRRLLEPRALVSAAPTIDRDELAELLQRLMDQERNLDTAEGVERDDLELQLVEICMRGNPNQRLNTLIRENLLPVAAAERLLRQLGLPEDTARITEQRLVAELLLQGAIEAAAAMFDRHLDAAMHRRIAQIKIVAVLPAPHTLPHYLTAVED
ncbi:GntR family transcriptional regulator [Acidisoma sp. C75]